MVPGGASRKDWKNDWRLASHVLIRPIAPPGWSIDENKVFGSGSVN